MTWDQPTFASFDTAIIATNHKFVVYQQLTDWSPWAADMWHGMAPVKTKPGQIQKA